MPNRRNTRKAKKGGIRLVQSNFKNPGFGYNEAGVFEGAPGSNNNGISRFATYNLQDDLKSIPGVYDYDAERLRRIGIENVTQLIGFAMMIAGNKPGSGAPFILYLRKAGLRYPALVARAVIAKIDNMLLRSIDYSEPIVPYEPNDVNYPDIPMPKLIIADFADTHGLEQRYASIIYDYATKFGLTLEKVFEIVNARSVYHGTAVNDIIHQLSRQISAFDRRKHALVGYAASLPSAGAATNAATNGIDAAAVNAATNSIDAAAVNAATNNIDAATVTATTTKARRQTRRHRI